MLPDDVVHLLASLTLRREVGTRLEDDDGVAPGGCQGPPHHLVGDLWQAAVVGVFRAAHRPWGVGPGILPAGHARPLDPALQEKGRHGRRPSPYHRRVVQDELRELALDLTWSWEPRIRRFFERVALLNAGEARHEPVVLLTRLCS